MGYKPKFIITIASVAVSPKLIAAAQHGIKIVKEWGMSLESIYVHDIIPISATFEG